MFIIDAKNRIKIIQGDTAFITLSLENYSLKAGDKVYFSVSKVLGQENYDIQTIVSNFNEDGSADIDLTKEQTAIAVGEYSYDIQVSLANGIVDTVVGPAKFTVLGGITND